MNNFKFINKYNETFNGFSLINKNSEACIIIISGMCEYVNRYEQFAKFLYTFNFSIFSIDYYNQGKNGNLGKGINNSFNKYVDTIDELALYLKKYYKKPVYIFSHSMGSFITQKYISTYNNVDKYVLCGSNYIPNYLGFISRIFSKLFVNKNNYNKEATILHKLSIGQYEKGLINKNDWISYNKENVERYSKDPLCGYRCGNGFYYELFKGLHSLRRFKNMKNLNSKHPILIIGGDNDLVSNNAKGLLKLNNFYNKNKMKVKIKIYKKMKHEILNESNNIKVYNDIVNFFKNK